MGPATASGARAPTASAAISRTTTAPCGATPPPIVGAIAAAPGRAPARAPPRPGGAAAAGRQGGAAGARRVARTVGPASGPAPTRPSVGLPLAAGVAEAAPRGGGRPTTGLALGRAGKGSSFAGRRAQVGPGTARAPYLAATFSGPMASRRATAGGPTETGAGPPVGFSLHDCTHRGKTQ